VKLAEALVVRADTQKRLEQIKVRLNRNAKVQEGEQPSEDPISLVASFEQLADELVSLIYRINATNSNAIVEGRSMTYALAERDILKQRQAMYRDLAEAATITQSVSTRSEVRYKSTVVVADMQKLADQQSKRLRELDARIQEANWLVDLSNVAN
jgi:hypothetical protein